jgi:DNA-binding transcriptional MerR regulator
VAGDSPERNEGIYSIGAVARMLGVPASTLRAWEERYQQVTPARSAGGQRLYSREQVDQLTFVRDQLELGLQPADAHRLLAQQHGQQHQQHQQHHQQHDQQAQRDAAAPAQPEPAAPSAGVATVLIAERDPYAAEFSDYFLRTEGYAVRVVLDAASAESLLRNQPPQVLVVDLLISGGAGLELCRIARETASVPVLAVSAVDTLDQALAAGAEAFLLKPLDPLQFVSTIRDLIGTSAYLQPKWWGR